MSAVGVGVAVWVVRDRQVLLGRRKGSHGAGTWAPPGGHIEWGETFVDAACREVYEETGLVVGLVQMLGVTQDFFRVEGKHYVTIHLAATTPLGGLPLLREPDRCEGWEWHSLLRLPDWLFLPPHNFLRSPDARALRQYVLDHD